MIHDLTVTSGQSVAYPDAYGYDDGSFLPTEEMFGACEPSAIQGSQIRAVLERADPYDETFVLVMDGHFVQETVYQINIPNGDSGARLFTGADATFTQVNGASVWTWPCPDPLFQTPGMEYTVLMDDGERSFNCDCGPEGEEPRATLQELRGRLLVRLGYAATAANPPPGMAALLDDFLLSAQRFLYQKYTALRSDRFFSWRMVPGVRFYDLPDTLGFCRAEIAPDRITWAGVEDDNSFWSPLIAGIPPELYTAANWQGFPSRYEVRGCIEVFPAPDKAYTLRIKARSQLGRFTENDDVTSIDSELVFLWALANAKNHYGHPDADAVAGQANQYLGQKTANKHGTNRYVPGTTMEPVWQRPKFLPVSGGS